MKQNNVMPDEIWIDAQITHKGYLQVEQFSGKQLQTAPINGNHRHKYIRADKVQKLEERIKDFERVCGVTNHDYCIAKKSKIQKLEDTLKETQRVNRNSIKYITDLEEALRVAEGALNGVLDCELGEYNCQRSEEIMKPTKEELDAALKALNGTESDTLIYAAQYLLTIMDDLDEMIEARGEMLDFKKVLRGADLKNADILTRNVVSGKRFTTTAANALARIAEKGE